MTIITLSLAMDWCLCRSYSDGNYFFIAVVTFCLDSNFYTKVTGKHGCEENFMFQLIGFFYLNVNLPTSLRERWLMGGAAVVQLQLQLDWNEC